MFLSETPIDLNRWNESQNAPPGVEEEREGMRGLGANPGEYDDGAYGGDAGCAQPLDVPALVDFVKSNHLPHSVIVDCSTAGDVTSDHAAWLSGGVHVVSGEGGEGGAFFPGRNTWPPPYVGVRYIFFPEFVFWVEFCWRRRSRASVDERIRFRRMRNSSSSRSLGSAERLLSFGPLLLLLLLRGNALLGLVLARLRFQPCHVFPVSTFFAMVARPVAVRS